MENKEFKHYFDPEASSVLEEVDQDQEDADNDWTYVDRREDSRYQEKGPYIFSNCVSIRTSVYVQAIMSRSTF